MQAVVTRSLSPLDITAPVIAAILFAVLASLLREPAKRSFTAIVAAGTASLYLNGGLGSWEFVYMSVATFVAYRGLKSYAFIGLAWLMHTTWDIVHHLYGNPIWLFAPTSSAGCAIMDAILATWFFAGAPSLFGRACAQTLLLEGQVKRPDGSLEGLRH
jgi:hypothetical protein